MRCIYHNLLQKQTNNRGHSGEVLLENVVGEVLLEDVVGEVEDMVVLVEDEVPGEEAELEGAGTAAAPTTI